MSDRGAAGHRGRPGVARRRAGRGIVLAGLATVLAGCPGDTASAARDGSSEGSSRWQATPESASLPACPAGPLLRFAPIAAASIGQAVPLGQVYGGHVFPTPHMYFYVRDLGGGDSEAAPVVAPGRLYVSQVDYRVYYDPDRYLRDPTRPVVVRTDYAVYFRLCRGVEGYLLHIPRLSDRMRAEVGAIEEARCGEVVNPGGNFPFRNCSRFVTFQLDAGEPIGAVGGPGCVRSWCYGIDFGMRDYRRPPLSFANRARYTSQSQGEDKLFTACPLDYLPAAVRDELAPRFVHHALAAGAPARLCGTTVWDLPPSARGNWFDPAAPGPGEDPHLALVPYHLDPDRRGVISVGTFARGLTGGQYVFTFRDAGSVNPRFEQVSPGRGPACFEATLHGRPAVFLVEAMDAEHLRVEQLARDTCPDAPAFSARAVIRDR